MTLFFILKNKVMLDSGLGLCNNIVTDIVTGNLIGAFPPISTPRQSLAGSFKRTFASDQTVSAWTFMRPRKRAATITDVAREAGVSVSTVSRVLNNKGDVSEETLEKVQKVIKDLGYASSLAARGLRSRRMNVIGLVMPDVASLYCLEIMRGVNRVITRLDEDLLIYTNGGDPKAYDPSHERAFVSLLNGGIADGVIVTTPTCASFPDNAPLVVIDPNQESPDHEVPAVISTNYEGALAAMNYLTRQGHRRIAHIAGRMELVSANQRLQGYKDGLCAAGIPFDAQLVELGEYRTNVGKECAHRLFALPDPPTAFFAANDMSAIGVYQAAREAGLRIPEDVSVVGFDNLHDAAMMAPPLTTVDQFMEEMGAVATEMVAKLINGEHLEKKVHVFQTQLIVRDSCCPPRSH
jgi:LacI family transcriptional regulator